VESAPALLVMPTFVGASSLIALTNLRGLRK